MDESRYSWRRHRARGSEPGLMTLGSVLDDFKALEPSEQGEFFRRLFADAPEIANDSDSCPDCNGDGVVKIDEQTGRQCITCYKRRKAERQRRIFQDADIPSEYDTAALVGYDETDQGSIERLRELADGEPCSAFIWAKLGRGKTSAAVALARGWLEQGTGLLFVTTIELLDRLKATFDRDGEGPTTEDVMRSAENAPVLILDDIGREAEDAHGHATAWACERMFTLVNYRQIRRLPTIYTSNKSIEQLATHYRDAALATRVRKQCGENVFHLQGRDRRSDAI